MSTMPRMRATLDDLMRFDGNAELIGGRIVPMPPCGFSPNRVAGRIYRSLDDHAEATGIGVARTDGIGFAVPELPSGRESFSPDAAYYDGPLPANRMRFVEGPPTFAVEVRSESERGPAAERARAAKRADYFAAGTLAVWDVDAEDEVIHLYRSDDPDRPLAFRRGDEAQAEPAVPGWRVALDPIFG